jgi:hypothetical protein
MDNKVLILYGFGFLNLIVMVITLSKILKKEEFPKYNKKLLILITVFIPVLGYILVITDQNKIH